MTGTITDYTMPQSIYMAVLVIFIIAIVVLCIRSIVISVRESKNESKKFWPPLKALMPLFLIFLAWFMNALAQILNADGWQGAVGFITKIYSLGRIFALEVSVLAILILALLYSIVKAIFIQFQKWPIIQNYIQSSSLRTKITDIKKWSGACLRKWNVRMTLLGFHLLLLRAGFVRLLDPYPYDTISTELLSLPAVIFVLLSNGRFFIFVLCISVVLVISLVFSGLLGLWNFLKVRKRYTWLYVGVDSDEAVKERSNRKKGFLIWIVTLILSILIASIEHLPVDTNTTNAILAILQYITINRAFIIHLALTTLVYIVNWMIARYKKPPPVGLSSGKEHIGSVLWLLRKPFALLFSAMAGAFEIAQNLLSSAIFVITGPRNEPSKNIMLYAAAGIASIVSFFNAFLSLRDFIISDDFIIIRTIITITISLAIQMAVLIFGIKAGENLAEIFYLYRLKRKTGTASGWDKAGRYVGWPIKRLVKYVFHIVPYVLFMIFSVYFAFTTMFSAYAGHVNLRQIAYYEVMREVEQAFSISERIAAMENEFYDSRTNMIRDIDSDVANLNTLRTIITNHHRAEAHVRRAVYREAREDGNYYSVLQSHYWDATSIRDRFINNTRELETTVDLIKNLIDMNFVEVGHVTLNMEYYHHHWINSSGVISTTYSYRSRSIRFDLPYIGEQSIGRRYTDTVPTQFNIATGPVTIQRPEDDTNHFRGANDRFVAARTSRSLPNVDKYGLLIHLYNYYIELRNLILSEATGIVATPTMREAEDIPEHANIPDGEYIPLFYVVDMLVTTEMQFSNNMPHNNIADIQSILEGLGNSDELTLAFRDTISRKALIDNLRDDIEKLYHERSVFAFDVRRSIYRYDTGSENNAVGDYYASQHNINISVRNLTRVASGTLRNLIHPRGYSDDLAFENLYYFVETSIELFRILSRLDFAVYTMSNDHTNDYPSFYLVHQHRAYQNNNSNDYSPVFFVRQLRAYAQNLAFSNFYLSLDVISRGGFGLNNTNLSEIYSAWLVATIFLLFALSKDFIPYAVGLLIHKDIYTIKTNNLDNLAEMGFFVLDDKLSTLFEAPDCEKLRKLHGRYVASLLYGEIGDKAEAVRYAVEAEEIARVTYDDAVKAYNATPTPEKKQDVVDTKEALEASIRNLVVANTNAAIEKKELDNYAKVKEIQLQAIDINLSCTQGKAQLTTWLDIHVKRDKILSTQIKELYK